MRFMMFVATDSDPDAKPEAPGEIETWVDDLEKSGKRITRDRLRPAGRLEVRAFWPFEDE